MNPWEMFQTASGKSQIGQTCLANSVDTVLMLDN